MQDPEFLYRQAAERLSELHAQAERRNMVRRAAVEMPARVAANRKASICRFLNSSWRWLATVLPGRGGGRASDTWD